MNLCCLLVIVPRTSFLQFFFSPGCPIITFSGPRSTDTWKRLEFNDEGISSKRNILVINSNSRFEQKKCFFTPQKCFITLNSIGDLCLPNIHYTTNCRQTNIITHEALLIPWELQWFILFIRETGLQGTQFSVITNIDIKIRKQDFVSILIL